MTRCNDPEPTETAHVSSRRAWIQQGFGTVIATGTLLVSPDAHAASSKILVLGGTGFVGSQVVEMLRKDSGVEVISCSKSGRNGSKKIDLMDVSTEELQELCKGCSAVISCVGAIGTPEDQIINAATGNVAIVAKAVGVERFVYITVAPEVKEFARGVDFLQGYMEGKTFSRDRVLENFPGDKAVLIEPTFIYGGGSFELNPPRVASFYGEFIEGLLSSSPVRSIERILSPGIIKIALEPPVPVEAVAAAAVNGALGKITGILDSYDKIKHAAGKYEESTA